MALRAELGRALPAKQHLVVTGVWSVSGSSSVLRSSNGSATSPQPRTSVTAWLMAGARSAVVALSRGMTRVRFHDAYTAPVSSGQLRTGTDTGNPTV